MDIAATTFVMSACELSLMRCASHFGTIEAGHLGKSRLDQSVVRSGVCVSDPPEVNIAQWDINAGRACGVCYSGASISSELPATHRSSDVQYSAYTWRW